MRPFTARFVLVCLFPFGLVLAADSKHGSKQSVSSPPKFTSGMADAAPENYKNAGVLVSFVDFDESGLGDALGYLLWGELTAVLGKIPKDYSFEIIPAVTATSGKYALNEDYHVSATALANDYQAPLTFWGAVRKKRQDTVVSTFLTLQPELRKSDLLLRVNVSAEPPSHVEAGLTLTRYEFTDTMHSADDLFKRRVVTRSNTFLLDQPREGGARVAPLGAGETLMGQAMKGAWYQVRMADGRLGYVNVNQLKVLPLRVTPRYDGLVAREGPGESYPSRTLSTTATELDVLDVDFDARGEAWYRVAVGESNAWVESEHAAPCFTLPVMHFLAGIYYFRAPKTLYTCQYRRAASQFSRFITASPDTVKNTNLAAAHQLYAASMLLSEQACGREADKAMAAYSVAIDLTPFDPTAYTLRAIANMGPKRLEESVVTDIHNALKWDNQDAAARKLIEDLHHAITLGTVTGPSHLIDEIVRLHRTVTREHVMRNMARIRQQHHLALDTKGKRVLPAPDQDVVLTFLNRSDTQLDVYVLEENSHPDSSNYYHVKLPDGDKTILHIAPGTYEIAAEASDLGVKSIYGAHTYASPSHYELDFLVKLNDAPIAQR